MERLIEFLMSNIYFVIIVIGLIYTMFFRKSPLERPPQQRPPGIPPGRMPDFGGSPVFPPRQRPISPADRRGRQPVERREPRPEYAAPASPPPVERNEPRPAYAGQPYADRSERRPDDAEPLEVRDSRPEWAPPPVMNARPVQASRAEIPKLSSNLQASNLSGPERLHSAGPESSSVFMETRNGLSRDDLTKAVLWAEILGPPRARRPFRR